MSRGHCDLAKRLNGVRPLLFWRGRLAYSANSGVTREPAVRKNINDALLDLRVGCLVLGKNLQKRHQRAYATAMRSNDSVTGQRGIPAADAGCELAIAFAAGRRKIPFVALALRQDTSVLFFNLGQCQTFPLAIGDLDQSVVDLVYERLKTERRPLHFHGLTRTLERA
jgi:hypothetical protein